MNVYETVLPLICEVNSTLFRTYKKQSRYIQKKSRYVTTQQKRDRTRLYFGEFHEPRGGSKGGIRRVCNSFNDSE